MPRKPTAVLVENQTELGHVIRDLLKDEGYHVVAVRTPDDALGVLREERVDLLVTDLPEGAADEQLALEAVKAEFPEIRLIELIDGANDPVPFFGPWRVSGSRMALRRPFRLDDLISASRALAARP